MASIQKIHSILGSVGSKVGSFVRDNPLLTGVGLGTALGVGGTLATQAIKRRVTKRRKKTNVRTRTKTRRKTTRRKARNGRRRGSRIRRYRTKIKRGRGLGRKELHHGVRGTKMVSFTTKDGRKVRFRVRTEKPRRIRRYR
jgi:hypothetical protein